VPGRRRGARTGRGWDAAPPRPRPARSAGTRLPEVPDVDADGPLWFGEEVTYQPRREVPGDTRDQPPPEAHDQPRQPGERSREPRDVPAGARKRSRKPRDVPEDAREPREPGEGAREAPDPTEQAREICLRLLAVRPRTRSELAAALRRRRISEDVAASVLDRYDEVGMIDDAAFARAWVSSRHHGRGLARRALAGELRRKGVESELVHAALDEVDEDTEAATARELVDRRLRTVGSGAPEVVLRRLVGVLARRGYPPGLALRVVKEALAEAADERTASYADLLDPDAASDLVGDTDDPTR